MNGAGNENLEKLGYIEPFFFFKEQKPKNFLSKESPILVRFISPLLLMNYTKRFFYGLFGQNNKEAEFFDRQLFSLKLTIFLTFVLKAIFLTLNIQSGYQDKSPHLPTNLLTILFSCLPAFVLLYIQKINASKFFAYFVTIFIQALSSYYVIVEGLPYGYAELALLPYVTACIMFYENPLVIIGVLINFALFVLIKIVRYQLYHLSIHELSLDLTMSTASYLAIAIISYLYKSDFIKLENNNKNINEQKQLIEFQASNLKIANNTKEKLLAVISHDLRSPIASLKNYMTLIDWGALSQDEFAQSTQRLNAQLNHVGIMLDNVLNRSLTQMEVIRPKVEKVAIGEIVQQQIQQLQPTADAKNIDVVSTVALDITTLADKNHLSIILRNLLQNALKFTEEGGAISISADKKNYPYKTMAWV